MTKEEAIEFLTEISYALGNMSVEYLSEKDGEKMRDAIKILEQQPCDDCISRQAVEEMIKAEMPERGMWEIEGDKEGDKEKETVCEVCVDLMQKLSELQPVTPQPKTWKWEVCEVVDFGDWKGTEKYKCSKCGEKVGVFKSNFCPNCGAKMVNE